MREQHRLHKKACSVSIMKTSCGHSGVYEPKYRVSAAEVAYFRAKAAYLRRVASTVKPGIVYPAVIIRLLERLADDFDERSFEIKRELKGREAQRD
jgi:hypothetical protein